MTRRHLNRLFFNVYFRQDEGGGGDGSLASFEEVFGRPPAEAFDRPNPFSGPDLGADDDDDAEGDEDEGEEGDEGDESDEGDEGDDGAKAAWELEMEKRFAPGTFTEEGWKAYRNMEIAFSQRQEQAPPPPPAEEPPPPPTPLLGQVSEITTEAQLYSEAQAAPERTAIWAMENREKLSPEQYNNVMNIWFVSNPNEYIEFREKMLFQVMNDHMQERFQYETEAQVSQARDQGIRDAFADSPLIEQYRQPLGEYMRANPHLNDWVNGLRTAPEVKQAVEAIFFMMAGRELSQQVLAQQVESRTKKAEEDAQAAAEGGDGGKPAPPDPAQAARTTRRSAAPRSAIPMSQLPDEEYAQGIQDRILNPRVVGRR